MACSGSAENETGGRGGGDSASCPTDPSAIGTPCSVDDRKCANSSEMCGQRLGCVEGTWVDAGTTCDPCPNAGEEVSKAPSEGAPCVDVGAKCTWTTPVDEFYSQTSEECDASHHWHITSSCSNGCL
jgi:hypothetical protein